MKISVTNIGPIKQADIDLAPLLVFVGPNNAGKSVLAATLYAALSQGAGTADWLEDQFLDPRPFQPDQGLGLEIQELLRTMRGRERPPHREEITGGLQEFLTSFLIQSVRDYATAVSRELERATGTPLGMLRRASEMAASESSLTITSERPRWQVSIHIAAEAASSEIVLDYPPDLWEALDLITARGRWRYMRRPLELLDELIVSLLREEPRRTRYLPAARSGILHAQKEIAGSIIRRSSSFSELTDQRRPTLTGIVADFLSEMIGLDPEGQGFFVAEADRLEQEILHGQITLAAWPNPEVTYRTGAGEYTLTRTSSMVSELAPVVLYLRHRLRRGDLLLIEEPEAHLHPATQVAFAQCLVRLVNQGLRVGLTTHSDFFLEQINNAIMAGAVSDEDAAELGVSDDRIDAGKVAAYLFQPSDSGTIIKRLPIDPKNGIPEESWESVTEQVYRQTLALDRRINGQD